MRLGTILERERIGWTRSAFDVDHKRDACNIFCAPIKILRPMNEASVYLPEPYGLRNVNERLPLTPNWIVGSVVELGS